MSYTFKVLPDEPIIWETLGEDFDSLTETEQTTCQELKALDASSQPMVAVVDMRAVPLTLEDIVYLANYGVPEEVYHHPRMRGIVLITTSDIITLAAQGMNTKAFGYKNLDVVASSEEALAAARRLLA